MLRPHPQQHRIRALYAELMNERFSWHDALFWTIVGAIVASGWWAGFFWGMAQ